MKQMKFWLVLGACLGLSTGSLAKSVDTPSAEAEAAYWNTVSKRAGKIVDTLGLDGSAAAARVRALIAQQYKDLRDIHDARDSRLAELKKSGSPADTGAAAAVRDEADLKLFRLHYGFLARLDAELTLEQIEQVKDGLTYSVLPNTDRVYREVHPNLTDEQKRQILAWLTEAREYAMDAGSSEAKHAWFGKYKGRITNYLAAAGYDAKTAEKEWLDRQKAAKAATNR